MIHADGTFATAGITVLREMVKSWWGEAAAGVKHGRCTRAASHALG